MKYTVIHRTNYQYSDHVPYGLLQLRLHPLSDQSQNVQDWRIILQGGKLEATFTDHNGNLVWLVSYDPGTKELNLSCEGEVETLISNGIYGQHQQLVPLWYFKRHTTLTTAGPGISSLVNDLGENYPNQLAMLHSLSELIIQRVAYHTGSTDSATDAETALKSGHGVCQDHAHIFISAARYLGYPARYVSGYLMINDKVDQDASHAWAEVFLPDLGWVGFDVSNGISPDLRYIRIATGLDYKEVAPISGMRYGSAVETMAVSLQVQQ